MGMALLYLVMMALFMRTSLEKNRTRNLPSVWIKERVPNKARLIITGTPIIIFDKVIWKLLRGDIA